MTRAFPHAEGLLDANRGMTLRDYFAAQAMLGLLSLHTVPAIIATEVAANAYALADAMLEERSNHET